MPPFRFDRILSIAHSSSPWSVQKLWQALLTAAQHDFHPVAQRDFHRCTTIVIGGPSYLPAGPAYAVNSVLSKGIAQNASIEAI